MGNLGWGCFLLELFRICFPPSITSLGTQLLLISVGASWTMQMVKVKPHIQVWVGLLLCVHRGDFTPPKLGPDWGNLLSPCTSGWIFKIHSLTGDIVLWGSWFYTDVSVLIPYLMWSPKALSPVPVMPFKKQTPWLLRRSANFPNPLSAYTLHSGLWFPQCFGALGISFLQVSLWIYRLVCCFVVFLGIQASML